MNRKRSRIAAGQPLRKAFVFFAFLAGIAFSPGLVLGKTLVISTQNQHLMRICEAVVSEALLASDLTVEYRSYPSSRALQMSNSGATDGELCRIKGIERKYPNLIRIDPLVVPAVVHVFSRDVEFRIDGWHSLEPYSIAIHRGHIYAERATRGMRAQAIGTDLQILRMLKNQRTDVAVLLTTDALKIMHAERIGNIKVLFPRLVNMSVYFYLHRKHADLVPRISASLEKMAANGRRLAIYREHLAPLNPEPDVLRDLVEAYDSSRDPE